MRIRKMKKNALVVIGIVAVLALGIIGVSAKTVEAGNNVTVTVSKPKLTIEAARKIALKKIAGEVVEETAVEEEKGKIGTYLFKIKKDEKRYEVEIDADTGDVLYAEEEAK